MNDLEFIREQVRTERRHMADVYQALAIALDADIDVSTLESFCLVAANYLVFIVQRFNQQDQIHCEQLRARIAADDDATESALLRLTRTLVQSRKAIAELAEALRQLGATRPSALPAACRNYVDFYRRELATQRTSLHPLMEKHYVSSDWRRASRVDADSILQERKLYDAVRVSLPAGIELNCAARPMLAAESPTAAADTAPVSFGPRR